MSVYDERLRELQRSAARKQQLKAMLRELYSRQHQLTDQVNELRAIMMSEQADVDRLECGSLTSFFYHVMGRKEEKLSREKEEAYAARVKYDAAALELSTLNEDVERKEHELAGLSDCEEEYERVFALKLEEMKQQGGANALELMELERRLGFIEDQSREVREAIQAGEQALKLTYGIMEHLESASDWATWDMFSDSCLTDMGKHNHLDQAQDLVQELQLKLLNFRTELADVSMEIRADLNVRIDGFMRFADYFFDDIFTDLTVRRQITDSMAQVRNTDKQIRYVLDELNRKLVLMVEDGVHTRQRLDQLVTGGL